MKKSENSDELERKSRGERERRSQKEERIERRTSYLSFQIIHDAYVVPTIGLLGRGELDQSNFSSDYFVSRVLNSSPRSEGELTEKVP